MNEDFKNLRQKSGELSREIKQRTVGYIVAAFGFVAGLAWNEAIKALIESFFPLTENTLTAKFGYAVVVTIVVVVLTMYLFRLARKEE